MASPEPPTRPRVFISYSRDSDVHRDQVLALAQRLRTDGIDAWLDLFELAPPQGWPRWMLDQVAAADFLVLVCTATYRRRFEGREDSRQGRGTTFEGLLASQLLYDRTLDHQRVVPVTFAPADEEVIPTAVRAATSHRLPSDYDSLRRRLTGELAVEPMPLGPTRSESEGLPADLSLADRLLVLEDEFESCIIKGEPVDELRQAILEVRRQLRSGPSLEAGDILAMRYRLIDVAGTGGFATVWKAYDRRTKQIVAVKILHGQWVKDGSRIERFQAGARRMLSLRHEAAVKMIAAAEQDGHHHFCVMEWLSGGNLERAVLVNEFGRRAALAAVARVAKALTHAHSKDIVHRDVKPANILLDEVGRGYITDFDLAQAKDSTQGTRTGGLGTFFYAAPEQQLDAAQVDARADVYSVGMCVLFVLLRRNPPPFVSKIQPRLFDELECGVELRAAVRLAVAYEAAERNITCDELAEEIEGELRDIPHSRRGPLRKEDPAEKECPAETADYPTAYFQDTVLIRLPKNVTERNFVEFTPTFARLTQEVASVSCINGVGGAIIRYMALTFFHDDPRKDLVTLRNQTLEVMGYEGYMVGEEWTDARSRSYRAVVDVPGHSAERGPARMLFQIRGFNQLIYAIVFEADLNSWNALKRTFEESADKMSFLRSSQRPIR